MKEHEGLRGSKSDRYLKRNKEAEEIVHLALQSALVRRERHYRTRVEKRKRVIALYRSKRRLAVGVRVRGGINGKKTRGWP